MLDGIEITQYRLYKGIKLDGSAGTENIVEDVQHLHEHRFIYPCNYDETSK